MWVGGCLLPPPFCHHDQDTESGYWLTARHGHYWAIGKIVYFGQALPVWRAWDPAVDHRSRPDTPLTAAAVMFPPPHRLLRRTLPQF